MATTRSSGRSGDAQKALAGIEKAHKELQLNLRNLRKALGGRFTTDEGGRFHNVGGRFATGGRFTGGGGKKRGSSK